MKKSRSMDYMGAILGFKKVYDMQSYSKASIALEISQPALSKRVYNLEALYEDELLTKKNGKMTLTKIGEIIYDEAVQFEKIYHETEKKIKQSKSETKKKIVGIDEQVYLNFIKNTAVDEIKYITFTDEHQMRKAFENKVVDSLIVKSESLQRFAHSEAKVYRNVGIEIYVHQSSKISAWNQEVIKSVHQLVYQRDNMSGLLGEFLNSQQLLGDDFEYVDNFELMYAKMMLNPEHIFITTSQWSVPKKYLDLIKKIEYEIESIDLYVIKK